MPPKASRRRLRKFLNTIDRTVPQDLDVHVILDNYATHSAPEIKRWLKKHPRFHFHFTPTYSSWLNQVERWFGLLIERAIKQGVHRSTEELEYAIREHLDAHKSLRFWHGGECSGVSGVLVDPWGFWRRFGDGGMLETLRS